MRRRVTDSGIVMPVATVLPDEQMAVLKQVEDAIVLHEQGLALGNTWAAEKAYRRILAAHPQSSRAHAMLGLLLQQKQQTQEVKENPAAIAMVEAGAEADLNDALVQANWGGLLYQQGRIKDAIEAYRRAVEAFPNHAQAFSALGIVLTEVCEHEAAIYAYERALQVEPNNYGYWCDLVFITDLAASTTFESAQKVRRRFNDQMVVPRLAQQQPHRNDRNPDRKLKIGYVSADMYQHSGAMTWGGFVVNHDRSQFHITLYSATKKHDAMTAKFKESCDQWCDIQQWSDDRLALQIQKDQIDVLVDLASFTAGGRLPTFAMRPAPVQLSGWGYATGLNLDCMDYFATDATVVPVSEEGKYGEQPWRLPSALSWVHPVDDMPVGHLRAAFGRPFTYGVMNRQPKITKAAIRAWVEIARRVPYSQILIKNHRMESPQAREALREVCVEMGARYDNGDGRFGQPCLWVKTAGEPSRIMFTGSSNHYDQLAAHWVIDVALDPFPQGGGVSSFESLWMGVPIVTLTDERPPGRIATSLLHQVGLDDWSCGDVETYIERAVAASQDIPGLIDVRESLRERVVGMPSLQLGSYTRAVEDGYRTMWRRWLALTADQQQEVAA